VPTKVRVLRGNDEVELTLSPLPVPYEEMSGAEIEYGFAKHPAGRIRTITTFPSERSALARDGKLPLVLVIPGFTCSPVETLANPKIYVTRIVRTANDAGFATLRADKLGVGDSTRDDGGFCEESTFDEETTGFAVALEQLTKDPRVDASRLFIVGISLGGVQAPLVAERVPTAGILSWGSGAGPWADYMNVNSRNQALWLAEDLEAADATLRAQRVFYNALMTQGLSIEKARELFPEADALLRSQGADPEYIGGRHYRFHRGIDEAPIWRAWMAFPGDVLLVHGEFDRVALPWDHQRVLWLVNERGRGKAEFVELPGLGHGMTAHDSLTASFTSMMRGQESESFYETMREWLLETAVQPLPTIKEIKTTP
jgi:pimeloyl-ACP methyl ester carboxylesterase